MLFFGKVAQHSPLPYTPQGRYCTQRLPPHENWHINAWSA